MKHRENDPILKEILGSDDLSSLRQASLGIGLAALRGRRRRRRVLQVGGVAAAAVLLALIIMIGRTSAPGRRGNTRALPSLTDAPAGKQTGRDVKLISDEELFALFPGRAVALIGKPGHQEFVFLDGGPPRQEIH
jgi:hypothetical protein